MLGLPVATLTRTSRTWRQRTGGMVDVVYELVVPERIDVHVVGLAVVHEPVLHDLVADRHRLGAWAEHDFAEVLVADADRTARGRPLAVVGVDRRAHEAQLGSVETAGFPRGDHQLVDRAFDDARHATIEDPIGLMELVPARTGGAEGFELAVGVTLEARGDARLRRLRAELGAGVAILLEAARKDFVRPRLRDRAREDILGIAAEDTERRRAEAQITGVER